MLITSKIKNFRSSKKNEYISETNNLHAKILDSLLIQSKYFESKEKKENKE